MLAVVRSDSVYTISPAETSPCVSLANTSLWYSPIECTICLTNGNVAVVRPDSVHYPGNNVLPDNCKTTFSMRLLKIEKCHICLKFYINPFETNVTFSILSRRSMVAVDSVVLQ